MYAPNIDNPFFFMKIREYREESTEMYTLLCGDLNLVLDPKMDSQNYLHLNNPKSRSILMESMQALNLSDIFRQLNPSLRRYSWLRRNPVKQACLDYAIGTNSLLDTVHSCNILPGYRSDHSRIEIKLLLLKKGKAYGVLIVAC